MKKYSKYIIVFVLILIIILIVFLSINKNKEYSANLFYMDTYICGGNANYWASSPDSGMYTAYYIMNERSAFGGIYGSRTVSSTEDTGIRPVIELSK